MKEFSEQLYIEVKSALEQIGDRSESTVSQNKTRVEISLEYISKLKQKIITYKFQSPEEEIFFFKNLKPKFSALLIYYSAIERVELEKPEGSLAHIKSYYENELKQIKRYFETNRQIYAYYRSEENYLDRRLFLRGVTHPPRSLCKLRVDLDERFSTSGDNIFARIIATEQLAQYLESAIKGVDHHPFSNDEIQTTWTGESINLLELAYGVFCTGQVNHGRVGLGELVRKLEKVFNVNLGRPYRRFTEIKQRKRLSRTKYLDDMAKSINKKIDDEDAYHPDQKK